MSLLNAFFADLRRVSDSLSRSGIRHTPVLVALACGASAPTLHVALGSPSRAGALVACAGKFTSEREREIELMISSSCSTTKPIEITVYDEHNQQLDKQSFAIELMAGREQAVTTKPALPRQSMVVIVEARARCSSPHPGEPIAARASCLAD